MKKIISVALGILLILIGLAGLLLPFLPGWLFIFVGLSFIAPGLARRLKRRLFRKVFKQDVVRLEEWKRYFVRAGFTTKHFPVFLTATDELLNLENQDKFKSLLWKSDSALDATLGSSKRFVFLKQVHGDRIVEIENEVEVARDGFYHFPEADGALTCLTRLTLLVMSADCLPIFFCAVRRVPRRGRGPGERKREASWIGLVHAGWRGTQKGIAARAFERIREKSDCRARDIRIAFGPSIGHDHYEVGPEFGGYFTGRSLAKRGEKLYFDLAGENRRQLLKAGALESRILDPKICTISDNNHFYSFRKEKAGSGRTVSFITKF